MVACTSDSTHSYCTVLPPPQNLMIVRKTSRSVTLSWDPPDPSSYDVSFIDYTIEQNKTEVATTSNTGHIVSGLTPYVLYQFSVRANYGGGNIDEKAHIEVKPLQEGKDKLISGFPQSFSLTIKPLELLQLPSPYSPPRPPP